MTVPAPQSPRALRASAKLWMLAGRLASPVTAAMLACGGVLAGRRKLLGDAGHLVLGRKMLIGPATARKLTNGDRVSAGIFSEVDLSRRMNLELPEAELDDSYIRTMGPKKDLGILLRALWSSTLDRGSKADAKPTDHFNLFGVIVNNSDTARVLETIRSLTMSHPNMLVQLLPGSPAEAGRPTHVCFVNANNFNLALEQPEYLKVLRGADIVLPDGIGVKLALQMVGGSLRKNLNGTDLMPHLADLFIERDWPIFLLGATKEILVRASANLQRRHPGIRIVGMRDGYYRREDEAQLCAEINASGAMALIIGMGTPRQELFAARNADALQLPLVLSMGGLIDFLGEKNRRAPLWMRQAGLEWVYRLLQEPGRMWRRYIIGNPVFLWRVNRWMKSRREPRKGEGTK